MEVREKYIARLMSAPEDYGMTAVKFIHAPQVITTHAGRLRCQYLCSQQRQSDVCPPFSPTQADTLKMLEEYRFGLFLRRAVPESTPDAMPTHWADFQAALLDHEREAIVRGYTKAFALAVGNCVYQHHDDTLRPCEYPGKTRPTLEAIGVNLSETLDIIGWDAFLVREEGEAFQMFALLLLE